MEILIVIQTLILIVVGAAFILLINTSRYQRYMTRQVLQQLVHIKRSLPHPILAVTKKNPVSHLEIENITTEPAREVKIECYNEKYEIFSSKLDCLSAGGKIEVPLPESDIEGLCVVLEYRGWRRSKIYRTEYNGVQNTFQITTRYLPHE